MTYEEIKDLCRHGKIGLIPYWIGYLKWNYDKDEIYFQNNDFIISLKDLESNYKITKQNDLYYII